MDVPPGEHHDQDPSNYSNQINPCNFCQGTCWHKIRRKPLRNRRKDKLAVKELFYEIQVDEGIL